MRTTEVLERPSDLTADWLSAALGFAVTGFTFERIGTGQMSECYRVELTRDSDADGPSSVVLKVAATDPVSRQTGLALGLYEREVRFYTDIAPTIGGGPVAACYSAGFEPDTGAFHLLLGDARPAVVGDELRGTTVEQATLALAELARLHAPAFGDASMAQADWLNRDAPVTQGLIEQLYAGFIDRYAEQIAPEHRAVCERLVGSFDAYLAAEGADDRIMGLVHGDYRLDNMLFGQAGADRPLTVVDWQTVTWGPAMTDVAYFVGCALPSEVRRQHYGDLLRAYHEALGPGVAISLDDVREGVRRQSFFGVMMAIVSSMLVEQTERGDQLFMTMLSRHADHVLETGALDLLPKPVVAQPLTPDPADEEAHAAGTEPLWSESWYFDFADPQQGIGGWVRLGLMPNENTTWVNALLCGPDMPTIALLDFHNTGAIALNLAATEPLKTYTVTVRGAGEAFDDPSDLLHGNPGRPVEATMDLVWTTVGVPYQYRITPRYEMPCTVSGTVTVDGREYAVTGVPGQRDHSWGVRDWWSMDWVWSALHLDDGTHLHGVDIRLPGAPPIGIGYTQRVGEPLVELQGVTAVATFGDDDLPTSTTITYNPGGVVATIDIRGHAPVLLTAPDGRISHFPRAWATVATADGRSGVGWVEWNRNTPHP
ncbi:phosphotransferase [Mycolicibacterium moriokaense]|uniref:Phosphotransferase n=1 Tax=Mycolicibacterium moriokaense TaxID=39691 RepID=A0AAD1M7L8_9MYCO|nr:phosphotransferase [Mycolicibacterium moriokaense]MCV7038283.1 phosphotransferase [Mycolicibacterium moriokaense]ORB24267.1 phosphotransferase [Mycolicibacterium moriokaense]BBX02599.1 phosphotransferase [Mycolicibacterium moriokaense]